MSKRLPTLAWTFVAAQAIVWGSSALIVGLIITGAGKWDHFVFSGVIIGLTFGLLTWFMLYQTFKPPPARLSIKSLFDEGLVYFKIINKDDKNYTFRLIQKVDHHNRVKFGPPTDAAYFNLSYMDGTGQTKIRLRKAYVDEMSRQLIWNKGDESGEEWKK